MVICTALGRLRWSLWNDLAASVFFNVRIVSKSHAEFAPPISAFMELCSNTNLPFSKSGPKYLHFLVLVYEAAFSSNI